MNIGEASRFVGLPVKTVRYYADIGLVKPSARSSSGYRIYDEKTLQKLGFVRRARTFGFSIEECRELLDLYENKSRSAREVKAIAKNRLEQMEQKQRELQQLHNELSRLINHCKGDERRDCPIIDGLSVKV